jgi:hypothetical protein
MVSSTPRPHFTPGKDLVPTLHEAGWAPGPVWMGGKSRPHRDSIPDRPALSSFAIPTELPGPHLYLKVCIILYLKQVIYWYQNRFVFRSYFSLFVISHFSLIISLSTFLLSVQLNTTYKCNILQLFSILCLTTDSIHQGHEKRKEIRDVSTFTAQHVRAATRSLKCERQ